MSKKKQHKGRTISLCIVGILIALIMGGNWFMTYRFENMLRKHLRVAVQTATDGFYDCTFDKLHVGLFSGDLNIQGVSLYPDTLILQRFTKNRNLPKEYYTVDIAQIDFTGINLTWIFSYKKLHFKKIILNTPSIEVVNPNPAYVASKYIDNKEQKDSVQQADKYLYEYISPYFDYIKVDQIKLINASTSLSIQDSLNVIYRLDDFNFDAHNFALDKASVQTHNPLYSEYFNFSTSKPQALLNSQHFTFDIEQIYMSTQDSIVRITGANFATKQKYWDKRYQEVGDWVKTQVGEIEITGISLAKNYDNTTFSASKFMVSKPNISYVSVLDKRGNQTTSLFNQDTSSTVPDSVSWSMYSLVSPIFNGVYIDSIDIKQALMEYTQSNINSEGRDIYRFQNLDVEALKFRIDSTSHQFNAFYYVKQFELDVDSLTAYIASNNSDILVEHFSMSTYNRTINLQNLNIRPIQISANTNYTVGHIDEIDITGLKYTSGITADIIDIKHPSVEFTLNRLVQKKQISKKKQEEEEEEKKAQTEELIASIAPFVSYLKVNHILIQDGKIIYDDRINRNRYELSNLNFKAKNFYLDPESEIIKDYFFTWDEYSIGFANFDNCTPDKKYRIKIKEGNFNSVTGDMLLKQFSIEPTSLNNASYLSLRTPYAKLQGLNQKEMGNKKLLFKTFTLESPIVEIVKSNTTKPEEKTVASNSSSNSLPFTLLAFDQLLIPSPTFSLYDETLEKSVQINAEDVIIDSLQWEFGKIFNVHKLKVDKPNVSWIQEKENNEREQTEVEKAPTSSSFHFEDVVIYQMDITQPNFRIKTPSAEFNLKADGYLLQSFELNTQQRSVLKLGTFDLRNPTILFKADARKKNAPEKGKVVKKHMNIKDLVALIPSLTNETYVDLLDIKNLNLTYEDINKKGELTEQKLNNTYLTIENVKSNKARSVLFIDDVVFKTKDYVMYLADSFYTVTIQNVYLSKAEKILQIDSVSMISNVPKYDFAYTQPEHKDWFNLNLGQIKLSGIDLEKYLKDTIMYMDRLDVNDVLLLNFKNKKIVTPPKLVPLLYQVFQNLPVKYYIKDVDVSNFSVIYDELEMTGYVPGQIAFTNMHGQVEGFTNIQSKDAGFYDLKATGLAFAVAPFKAVWSMPIDSTTNEFYLTAQIAPMELNVLNNLIRPMAPAYIKSGKLLDLQFSTVSTAQGATVNLKFLYDSLYVSVLKNMSSDEENYLLTQLVNHVAIKRSNLEGKKLRLAHEAIIRDPYHSNFNYFWQILKPALISSAGIGDREQNLAKKLGEFFTHLQQLFKHPHENHEHEHEHEQKDNIDKSEKQ